MDKDNPLIKAILDALGSNQNWQNLGESNFFQETVDALIAEPDPEQREKILAGMDSKTRGYVESVYAERVRRMLESLQE